MSPPLTPTHPGGIVAVMPDARAVARSVLAFTLVGGALLAGGLQFEAASIKPYSPSPPQVIVSNGKAKTMSNRGVRVEGNRLRARNETAKDLIEYAYDVTDYRLSGGPAWMSADAFDIDAKADGDEARTREQLMEMLRGLLEDRFKLKSHFETRDVVGIALVVDTKGTKLKPSAPDAKPSMSIASDGAGGDLATYNAWPVAGIVQLVQSMRDRPVSDRTGLTGRYDYKLALGQDASLDALQGDLGLKLQNEKLTSQVLVVDSLDRPSAN